MSLIEAQFLYNPEDKGSYCHAPTLLETTTGDLLVAWYTYGEEEHRDASLTLARRRNNEIEWGKSQTIIATEYSAGNPVLFQEPQGRIWLLFVLLRGAYWNDAILEGAYSDDNGFNWSAPLRLWDRRGMMAKHPPVQLGKRSLMLPVYDEISSRSILLVSHNPFTQWREAYRFADVELIQPVLIRESPGKLAIFFRPCSDPRRIWRSHSEDDGVSWSGPIRTPLPCPLSGIGAFVVNGCIAVVHNHTEKHQRYPLSISLSHDGGSTWDPPWDIDSIQYEVSYPCFLTGKGDLVHGVYTYNRRFIKYVAIHKNQFLQAHGQNRRL